MRRRPHYLFNYRFSCIALLQMSSTHSNRSASQRNTQSASRSSREKLQSPEAPISTAARVVTPSADPLTQQTLELLPKELLNPRNLRAVQAMYHVSDVPTPLRDLNAPEWKQSTALRGKYFPLWTQCNRPYLSFDATCRKIETPPAATTTDT